MSKKIGELLVERGTITAAQLKQTLTAQLIHGGHLGTCMIELGFVRERELGQLLGEIYGVKYATLELFEEIPSSIIGTVPKRLVEKYHSIPIGLKGRLLHLAMRDPKNIQGIDEISFASGCRIQPWVAPEIRIVVAMEIYYGIPRSRRFITLCGELDRSHGRSDAQPAAPVAEPDSRSIAVGEAVEPTDEADADPPHAVTVGVATMDIGTDLGYDKSWREVAGELFLDPSERVAHRDEADVDRPRAPQPDSLETVADRLCQADCSDDISKIVLDFATRQTPRCVLFKVGSSVVARVWDWRGLGLTPRQLERLRFPVTSEAIFELMGGAEGYRGPVPDEGRFRGFFDRLGLNLPAEIVMYPVYLDDRVVAIFYGDGGATDEIEADSDTFHRLMQQLNHALHMLVHKQKIRTA
jgi:hypothetical protein